MLDNDKQSNKTIDVKVIPTRDTESKRIYANYFTVNHGPFDFTFTFCDARPPLTDTEKNDVIDSKIMAASVQVEIAIPIGLMEPIIKALKTNYDIYKKSYGKDEK
ncbi:MAG: DUF3467 domain-containing protein [Deltaproteobacteria bacterium]|uniref:DUF3467 domain-containing protein n=1 Tax=Candidatus Zymogenus saltonus TaxID=2844893 RepID=A0A9D8KF51_9DELT|nr:DUF3467 domain-containing protein [Candidatus Zymogenus saltonus]